jgi:small subunit ribosomal protein S17e
VGNVRPNYIKRLAHQLVAEMPEAFSDNFENNKVVVDEHTNIASKTMRNRVAGYIATLKEPKREEDELPTET